MKNFYLYYFTGRGFPCYIFISFSLLAALANPGKLTAQQDRFSSSELKKLTLEELMNIEVTSVSKTPEKLTAVASAIQVITQEEIHQSGAKTLPEALKLAPNLQVAQVNASQWAISARGFNNVLANKLLVLIDGRSVYTPLYAGVFWDVQNLILEDVERIEVISGPGGTLWGANAVNGVINIITKDSKDTQGLFVEGAIGTSLPRQGNVRYGGEISEDLSYKIYGTGFKMASTLDSAGSEAGDDWSMLQGGVQFDWKASDNDQLTLQQNTYRGRPNPEGQAEALVARGDNIAVRWDHERSNESRFTLHAYYDHTFRDFKNGFDEDLKTYNVDWHNQHPLGNRHSLSFGINFRYMDHKVTNLELFKFLPAQKDLWLYSLILQDEIALLRDRLQLTLGIKFEHNSYTGLEYLPNGRITWTLPNSQILWAAVSRAVRTPARIDRDFYLDLTPELSLIAGNRHFKAMSMLAYELGWRRQFTERATFSIAAFYNTYDHIRSSEPGPPPFNIPVTFANGVQGETYGTELSAALQVNPNWSLRGGYTFLKKKLRVKPWSQDLNGGTAESNDPTNQFLVQSAIRLPGRLEFGTVLRYIDDLPEPYLPSHFGIDVRLGWQLNEALELSVVGQNIGDGPHPEFIPSSPAPRQIEPAVYGKITLRY